MEYLERKFNSRKATVGKGVIDDFEKTYLSVLFNNTFDTSTQAVSHTLMTAIDRYYNDEQYDFEKELIMFKRSHSLSRSITRFLNNISNYENGMGAIQIGGNQKLENSLSNQTKEIGLMEPAEKSKERAQRVASYKMTSSFLLLKIVRSMICISKCLTCMLYRTMSPSSTRLLPRFTAVT